MAIEELQEKRNALATQIRQHADKFHENDKQWPDAEAKANWEKLNADYDSVVEAMDAERQSKSVADRLQLIQDMQSSVVPGQSRIGRDDASTMMQGGRGVGSTGVCTEEHRSLALAGWMRSQLGEDVTPEMEEAARMSGLRMQAKSLNFASPSSQWLNGLAKQFQMTKPSHRRIGQDFYNAPLTTQTAGTGGNVIPPESLIRELEINLLSFSPMSQFAELMVTQTGETLSWPTVNDTDHIGVQIGENTDLSNSGSGGDAPDFAKVQWEAWKLSSQMILVPFELLEDNVVNLAAVLGQLMGERIGRLRNQRYTTGAGTTQALGIVTAATVGVTAASETAIAADEVYDLQHSVDPAYRQGAQFMCHDNVVLHLRKLKDQDNRYLWQSDFNTGAPDTLAGSPLVVNQDMSSTITAEDKTLLFGQLSKYKIRRVNGFRMYRLTERYRDTDQDGFMLLLREDGNLLTAGTPPVKVLQQKAAT